MTLQDWRQLDCQVEAVQFGDVDALGLNDDGFVSFLHAHQYIVPRPCSDGTVIFDALLGCPGTSTQTHETFLYKLPAKLAGWQSGKLADIHFKIKKGQNLWSSTLHSVWQEVDGSAGSVGGPVFEVSLGRLVRFSMGHDGEVGQAHMQLDGRDEEVCPVIFQQGGPIDPFFGRPLSRGIQNHILGISSYMMSLLRAAKHPSLPSAHVREVPGVACLEKNLMVLEWNRPGVKGCT